MKRHRSLRLAALAVLAALALVAAGCGDDGGDEAADDTASTDTAADDGASGFEGDLVGTFEITVGECADAGVTAGSYFRMVQPGGTVEDGPFIDNGDSVCGDTTFTVLSPGTDGGLTTGTFQPAPDPAFDDAGNATSGTIIAPVPFFGLAFSAASDEADGASAPQITATDGVLSGDLSALAAYYGGEVFNQGAPKPGGENPGLTSGPTGTIDAETGAFVLEWTSQIEGGAFNEFSGVWHLEGTFTAA